MQDIIAADVSHAEPDERPVANDLRHAMMTLPVEQQDVMLAEYVVRRDNFRRWLMHQLEEGKHYGVPPGCEPKQTNPRQWQAQPSLYAAGADLLCDLLTLRAEYKADIDAWQQLGSKPGYVVMICRLYSRANGTLIGEGRGARKEGQKGGDLNNAIKMAQKSAKVDAVLNCYGLRDMFTQDLENLPTPHENPEPNPSAPTAPPRGGAPVSRDQCAALYAYWQQKYPTEGKSEYELWVRGVARRGFAVFKSHEWTPNDYHACCRALNFEPEAQ